MQQNMNKYDLVSLHLEGGKVLYFLYETTGHETREDAEFLYEEHQCTSNLLRGAESIILDDVGNLMNDPHYLLNYVTTLEFDNKPSEIEMLSAVHSYLKAHNNKQ